MKIFGLTPTGSGEVLLESEPLGRGGEGSVYGLQRHAIEGLPKAEELVAKLYHTPEEEQRQAKIKAMIENPVADPSLAWPLALLLDEQKHFKGYLMVKLPGDRLKEWLYVSNAKDRRQVAPAFDVRHALTSVRNLAVAMLSVHSAGHRIGDVNESNIFVGGDASVLIVDTDSMQVQSREDKVYPCVVGKPEYTAPELTVGSLRDHRRTEESDVFALAVAAHQMLTGGASPHMGAFDPRSTDDPLPLVERIRKGILPGLAPAHARGYGFTSKPGVPTAAIPQGVQDFLRSYLSVKPKERLRSGRDLHAFIELLDGLLPKLAPCPKVKTHWLVAGEPCKWCLAAGSGLDPWSTAKALPSQVKLPAVPFHAPEKVTPQRAPASPTSSAVPHPQIGSRASSPQLYSQRASVPAPPQARGGGYGVGAPVASPGGVVPLQTNPYHQAGSPQPSPPAAAVPTPMPPARPEKIRGKLVVEYAHGGWGPRPPLGVLLAKNPKLFWHAVKEETPEHIKFYWPVKRPLASPGGLFTASILSIPLAALWLLAAVVTVVLTNPTHWLGMGILLLGALGSLTALLTTWALIASAARDRSKVKKKYGSLVGFSQEKGGRTFLRILPIVLTYGPLFVLYLIVLLLMTLVGFMGKVAKA